MFLVIVFDLLSLQTAWFTAANLHDQATPWLLLILFSQLCLHLGVRSTFKPALRLTLIGMLLEILMIFSGMLSYNSAYVLPIWLPMLWLNFGFSMSHALHSLRKLPLWAQASIGACSGCISYQTADAFEVLQLLPEPLTAGIFLFIVWAIALPVMVRDQRAPTAGVLC